MRPRVPSRRSRLASGSLEEPRGVHLLQAESAPVQPLRPVRPPGDGLCQRDQCSGDRSGNSHDVTENGEWYETVGDVLMEVTMLQGRGCSYRGICRALANRIAKPFGLCCGVIGCAE